MSIVQELPRSAVQSYLRLTRLPLTVVERIVNPEAGSAWPPAVAYEDFEARVKAVAATFFRDDVLRKDATLQQARVAQLRRAVELEAQAEATRARADDELSNRRRDAAEDREEADRRADENAARLERERAEAEQRTADRAAEKEREAEEAADAERDRIQREERAAEAARLAAERETLAERSDAIATRDEAVRLEAAAEAAKDRRKSKSA